MILAVLILIPLFGGLLAWLAERWGTHVTRWVALLATGMQLAVAVGLWVQHIMPLADDRSSPWFCDWRLPWIPYLGINVHLALDGLSLLLVLLTAFIGILSVLASWEGITEKVGFFHFNVLWTIAGITGIFLSFDLFLFYVCWEVMLVPLFFLIDQWGYERRHQAASKFFIFTQVAGLFLLLGVLGLVYAHYQSTHLLTFDYFQLLGTTLPVPLAFWLMLGFFIAFAVKLPAVPLHTWLPDAHTQAPIAGSVDLAGLVLKVGAYGLLRFTIPLFPQAALAFAPVAMTLAVIGILYGAVLAFAQTDLKRLVAYTSISHMGFVLLGIFAWNDYALAGVVVLIIAHGISTGSLFIMVGVIRERIHSRCLDDMGGMWECMPRMGGVGLFFALAALGLPGLGTFVGEILVLIGVFAAHPLYAIFASIGFILATIYALWMMQRVFFGAPVACPVTTDLTPREIVMLTAAIAVMLWLGLYPQPVLNATYQGLHLLKAQAQTSADAAVDDQPVITLPGETP